MGSSAILDRRAVQTHRAAATGVARARTPRSLIAGIAVAAMVFAIIGIGAHHCAHGEHGEHGEHHHGHGLAHAGLATTGHVGAVGGHHCFTVGGSAASYHPEQLASAVRPHHPGAAAGVGVAVTVVAAGLPSWTWAGRDPPRRPSYAMGGRSLLTRFCLARR